MAVFMLIFLGPLLAGLFFPEAITNSHLDSTAITPLNNLRPGETVKIYAVVAPNETDVIHGYWGYTSNGGRTWLWTAKNFWITEGTTSIFVSVSSLLFVSQPGNPWGSENGVANYTGGSPIAIYGVTVSTSNGTRLDAQYVATTPTSMGHPGGYLWPIAVGAIVVPGVASIAAFFAVRYQRRQHESAIRARPPTIPPPHPRPTESKGSVTRYVNTRLSVSVRRSWVTTGVSAAVLALGIPLFLVNYIIGIFLLSMGGVFLAGSFLNRSSYGKSPTVISTDDQGLSIEPLSPLRYKNDRYVPWDAVVNFHVYFGQTLALRTDRGELTLTYLSKDLVAQIASEMQTRGIKADEPTVFHPVVGSTERFVPLRPMAAPEWEQRNRLSGTRLTYSLIVMTASIVGLTLIFSSILFSTVSSTVGGLVLILGFAATGVSLYFVFRLRALVRNPTPGDEAARPPAAFGPAASLPSPPAPVSPLSKVEPAAPLPSPGTPGVSTAEQYPAFPRQMSSPAPPPAPPLEVQVAPVRDYWASGVIEMPGVFPRGLLFPGERVLYEVRPTYWGIYGPATVAVVLLMLLFLAPVTQPGYVTNPFFGVFEALFVLLILVLWRSWHGLAFALTDLRVLTVNGRRGTQGREGPVGALQRVALEGLMGGTVTFSFVQAVPGKTTPRTRKVRWPGLKGAPAVYAHIQRLLAETAARRTVPSPP